MGGEGKEKGIMDSSPDRGHEEPTLKYPAGRGGDYLYCSKIQK